MNQRRGPTRILLRYALLQLPGLVLLVLILVFVQRWVDLPAWVFWGSTAIWVVKDAILYAGDLLMSPYRLVDRFNTFVGSHEAFQPFLASGLLQAITDTAQQSRDHLFETPQTVSWERVIRKMPGIIFDIIDVLEKEKALYKK